MSDNRLVNGHLDPGAFKSLAKGGILCPKLKTEVCNRIYLNGLFPPAGEITQRAKQQDLGHGQPPVVDMCRATAGAELRTIWKS